MSADSQPDLLVEISVAWPIWADGYPRPDEAIEAAAADLGRLERDLQRALAAGVAAKVQVSADLRAGDHVPVPGPTPDPPEPNSLVVSLAIELEGPDGRLPPPGDLAERAVSVTGAFVVATMPGASRGADLYEVRLARWESPTGRLAPDLRDDVRSTEDPIRFVRSISTTRFGGSVVTGVAITDEIVLCPAWAIDGDPAPSVSVPTGDSVRAEQVGSIGADVGGVAVLQLQGPLPGGHPPIDHAGPDDVLQVIMTRPDTGISTVAVEGSLDDLAAHPPPDLAAGSPVFARGRLIALALDGHHVATLADLAGELESLVPGVIDALASGTAVAPARPSARAPRSKRRPTAGPTRPPTSERPGTPAPPADDLVDLRDPAGTDASDDGVDLRAPLEPGSLESYDPAAVTALGMAEALRLRADRDRVHMEHLVVALADHPDGPLLGLGPVAGDPAQVRDLLGRSRPRMPPAGAAAHVLTALPAVSGHVTPALGAAARVARATGSPLITLAHLAYGVLSVEGCSVVEELAGAGIVRDGLGIRYPPRFEVASIKADTAAGEDLLDLGREVGALAAVIAADDVEPPLSVGLFGDWGSGKTFFMKQLEATIRANADEAKEDPDSIFCENIVQLWFNAWHYMDTDLWASLASEIFERLGWEIDRRVEDGQRRAGALTAREQLLAAAVNTRDVVAIKEKQRDQARSELAASQERLDRLDKAHESARLHLDAGAIAAVVLDDPTIRAQLTEVGTMLGLPEVRAAQRDVQRELVALGSPDGGLLRALLIAWRNRSLGLWRPALTAVAVILAVGLAAVAARTGVVASVVAAVPVLGTLGAVARTWATWITSAVAALRVGKERYEDAIRPKQARIREREESRLQDLTDKVGRAEQEVADGRKLLVGIEEQLVALRADRRVAQFIRERNESRDYARYFGSVAQARTDFERLRHLLQEVADETADSGLAATADGFPRIDRIVLYIDDLDRCPEDKVVAVLQAVHLLLAIPLFVVVVGVDSRWLLHSLRKHSGVFDQLHDPDDEFEDEDQARWQSTPLNYLEKIFQIPFTLRPMEPAGFQRMIGDMVKPVTTGRRTARPDAHPSAAAAAATGPSVAPDGGRDVVRSGSPDSPAGPVPTPAPSAAPPPTAVPAATVRIASRFLRIEDWEQSAMATLYPLIPSPRAAKRFVNVYRLLRATLTAEEFDDFVRKGDGDHRVVLLLHAIITGHPVAATEVVRRLVESTGDRPWWTFVEELRSMDDDAASAPARMERERWRALTDDLARVERPFADVGSIARFRRWAPRVARYSFQSGRVVLDRPPARPAAATRGRVPGAAVTAGDGADPPP